MASHALALYTGSCSTYNLDGVSASIDLVPESTFVREDARAITMTPLAIMPPPSSMSGSTSLKSTTRTKAPQGGTKSKQAPPMRPLTGITGLKRKAPKVGEKKTHVTPLGSSVSCPSTRPSPSYTIVGVKKPDGGYGKALMRKSVPKGKESAEALPRKPAPKAKETVESSSQFLRIRRFREPPVIKRPPGIFESSDEETIVKPRVPPIALLSAKVKTLCEDIRNLNGCLAESLINNRNL